METYKVIPNPQEETENVIEAETIIKRIETKQQLEMRLKMIDTQLAKLTADKKLIEEKLEALT